MPYRGLEHEPLILRDLLARDRTVMANERTLLSYMRTALMLAGSGISLYKLVPEGGVVTTATSAVLVLLGMAVMAWGARSYRRVKRQLASVGNQSAESVPVVPGGHA